MLFPISKRAEEEEEELYNKPVSVKKNIDLLIKDKLCTSLPKETKTLVNCMPFPNRYKKALEKGKKNITMRMGNEQGKYKEEEVYVASSYDNNPWNIKLKIKQIITVKAKDIKNKVRELKKLKPNELVDIIRFKTYKS